jgi:hypothetical protein
MLYAATAHFGVSVVSVCMQHFRCVSLGFQRPQLRERFERWSVEQAGDFIFALSSKRSISFDDRTATSELAFVCNHLMQRWENGLGCIFLGSPDEQEELASYLKDREAEGVKSVHFYFPNDLDASTQTTNHMVVDVAEFSSGVATFTSRCEQAR